MASSARLMPSSVTANSDIARTSPIYSMDPATGSNNHASSSTSIMDDLIRNMYESSDNGGSKIVDEVWKEISGRKMDGGDGSAFDGEITLEEYLSKEEVRVPAGFGADPTVISQQQQLQQQNQEGLAVEEGNQVLGFGNGSGESGGRGRGKKRPVLDPVDRAALQRQKRMIKNRESAARSRERKQAYTAELEGTVLQLERDQAELLREQEELHRQRLKQLMENLIPVTEGKKPPRVLRRTHSMMW